MRELFETVMNRSDTYSASGSVDAMVVGFEKIEEIDDFAARIRKVPVVGGPAGRSLG